MGNSREKMGFRFLVFIWIALTIVAIPKVAYEYYLYTETSSRQQQNGGATIECIKNEMGRVADCRIADDGPLDSLAEGPHSNECQRQMRLRCYYKFDPIANTLSKERYAHQQALTLVAASWAAALLLSALIFYGLRWVFTGKIRPLLPE